MRLIKSSLLAGLCALACASGVFAQSAATLPVKNGSGSTVNIAGQTDASGNFHYRDVMEGLDGSGNPYGLNVDPSSRDLIVFNLGSPFQAGGSIGNAGFGITGTALTDLNTMAAQTPTLNGDGGAPAHVTNFPTSQLVTGTFWQTTQPVSGTFWQATQPISAASLPLPTGAMPSSGGTVGISGTLPAFASTPTFNCGTGCTAGAAATPASSTTLESNHVLKASAGTLYSFEVAPDSTLGGSAWYILIFDATAAPADGAVTPKKCYGPISSTAAQGGGWASNGIAFSTGITIVTSTTGCFTKTASAHAFISGDYQ